MVDTEGFHRRKGHISEVRSAKNGRGGEKRSVAATPENKKPRVDGDMGISSEDGSQASPSKGKGEANKKVSIAAYLASSFKGRGSGHGRPLLANHSVFKIEALFHVGVVYIQ